MALADLTEGGLRRLLRDIEADRAAVAEQAQAIQSAGDDAKESTARLAIALHHFYTAFESAAERIIRALDGDAPTGPEWHKALLEESLKPLPGVRPAIVGPEAHAELRELLRFRHFFRHAYGVPLDPAELQANAERALLVEPLVRAGLEHIGELVRAAVAELSG